MARYPRFVRTSKSTVYHVISRTALPGLPLLEADKDYLLGLIKKWSKLYCVDVLGFAIMGNHTHLVIRMYAEDEVSDETIIQRFQKFYGDEKYVGKEQIDEAQASLQPGGLCQGH